MSPVRPRSPAALPATATHRVASGRAAVRGATGPRATTRRALTVAGIFAGLAAVALGAAAGHLAAQTAERSRPPNPPRTHRDASADTLPALAGLTADALARRALVAGGRHPALRHARLSDVRDALVALYGAAWRPAWLDAVGRPTPQARALTAALGAVDAAGLPPADFEADRLPRLAAALGAPEATAADRAAYEVAASVAALRLVRALRFGRLDPRLVHPGLAFVRPPFDAAAAVRALAGAADVAATLRAHEPPHRAYRLARRALAGLRTIGDAGALPFLPPLPAGRSVKPGERYAGVPALRRLLTRLGDLPPEPAAGNPFAAPARGPQPTVMADASTRFAAPLPGALARYQARHGLAPDSILGARTLASLRRPLSDRIRTLALALERWRWLPRRFDQPPLIVNIPAFRLDVYGNPATGDADWPHGIRIVVGAVGDNETPVFADTLTHLVFSPYWVVPERIAREEILPPARADLGYLDAKGYEIVRGQRDDAPVLAPSDSALDLVARGLARIRQRPCGTNSLGRAKFIFPNPYDVYLHDTPARALFARPRRDFSHGCVRVADPEWLARHLLAGDPAWTDETIAEAMAQDTPRTVRLMPRRPVLVLYITGEGADDGTVRDYPDIYGHDARLAARLAEAVPGDAPAGHASRAAPRGR